MRSADGRRLRHQPPEPGTPYRLTSHLPILKALAVHRYLSTNLLHRFSGRTDYQTSQIAFKRLYNGWCKECGDELKLNHKHTVISHLSRLREQFDHPLFEQNDLIHSLTEYSEAELDRLKIPRVRRGGHFKHALMGGHIGGSTQLALDEKKVPYYTKFDVLACTNGKMTLELSDRRKCEKATVTPDDLFSVGYKGDIKRAFVREDDRSSAEGDLTHIWQHCLAWIDVLITKVYQDAWDMEELYIQLAFTNETSMNRIKHQLYKTYPKLSRFFLLKTFPHFGTDWRVPKGILKETIEPWDTTDGLFDLTKSSP